MSVTLQWEPPSDTGGRPILGYVVEKKDKFSADWVEVCRKFLHRCSLELAIVLFKNNLVIYMQYWETCEIKIAYICLFFIKTFKSEEVALLIYILL